MLELEQEQLILMKSSKKSGKRKVNTIDFLTVEILGNAQDFGDLNHVETSVSCHLRE